MLKNTYFIIMIFTMMASCTTSTTVVNKSGVTGEKSVELPPEKLDFDRTNFGNSNLPFWSHLSEFEIQTLQNVDNAKQGDPDALLALAVLASGDQREMETFSSYQKRVHEFIEKIKPKIEKEEKFWQKGYILHRAMHKEFFPSDNDENELNGYKFSKSNITAIFEDKEFNCISSAILFIVLARYFDFEVNGVLIPSHAFAQFISPEGKIYEVETTSNTGFDWVHDKKYYAQQNNSWSRKRGLKPSTYEDYQKKEIVQPYQLIAHNMSNQHTRRNRMDIIDRRRLKEASGYVDIDSKSAQQNRYYIYNTEYNYLEENKDYKTLELMLQKIEPNIEIMKKRWRNNAEIMKDICWLEIFIARNEKELGNYSNSMNRVDILLEGLKEDCIDFKKFKKRTVSVISNILYQLLDTNKLDEAFPIITKYKKTCTKFDFCKSKIRWYYGKRASSFWDKKLWAEAIENYELELANEDDDKDKMRILDNISGAYNSWANEFKKRGNWPKAVEVLEQCTKNHPEIEKCKTRLEKINSEHKM